MNQFGVEIKHLRERKGLLQRQVASHLDIDSPMLSKIERGERHARRSQVTAFSRVFDVPEERLLSLWLADKVVEVVQGEKVALEAIGMAEAELKNHLKNNRLNGH